jgi:hypothetical protein
MGFSSRPLISLPIINLNQETLQAFARNCHNNDVQSLHEIEKLLMDLKVVIDESYIVEVHIQNLWKQGLAWNLHNYKFLRIIWLQRLVYKLSPKVVFLG